MVWPKLRMRRRPPSRSSRSTTLALSSQQRRIMGTMAAGSSASMAGRSRSSMVKEVGVDGGPVLDHLGHAAAELLPGQGAEHVRVDEHGPRLVEGADQVLALGQVHAGLAAHRAVHLGEQGGGHLHERNAAKVDRGEEPGHVAGHAAAQGEDGVAAVKAALGQVAGQSFDGGQVLARLAVGKGEQLAVDTRGAERIRHLPAVERPDHVVADDRPAPADARLGQPGPHRVEHAAADDDRVTPLPQADLHRFRSHTRFPCVRKSSGPCGRRPTRAVRTVPDRRPQQKRGDAARGDVPPGDSGETVGLTWLRRRLRPAS